MLSSSVWSFEAIVAVPQGDQKKNNVWNVFPTIFEVEQLFLPYELEIQDQR